MGETHPFAVGEVRQLEVRRGPPQVERFHRRGLPIAVLGAQRLGLGSADVEVLPPFLQDVRQFVRDELFAFERRRVEPSRSEEDVVGHGHRFGAIPAGDPLRALPGVHPDALEIALEEVLHPVERQRTETARLVQLILLLVLLRLRIAVVAQRVRHGASAVRNHRGGVEPDAAEEPLRHTGNAVQLSGHRMADAFDRVASRVLRVRCFRREMRPRGSDALHGTLRKILYLAEQLREEARLVIPLVGS